MLELVSSHACHGGEQRFYRHDSAAIGLPMKFSVYLPPQAAHGRVPALFYLAGPRAPTRRSRSRPARSNTLRSTRARDADTAPRGAGVPGETDAWDFGVGAGFYIDATEAPWSTHYRMESYVTGELRELVAAELPIDGARLGIFGHSMGGHGALTLALRHPGLYRSVSAFAPIAAPTRCPWGEKAFSGYLGADREAWKAHDASELVARADAPKFADGILVDQGLADQFLANQLNPDVFEAACAKAGQPLTLRRHPGYDHGYYFISTFIADHIAHHARVLAR